MEGDNGTVLVTGSSRGIGKAIALRLARDGYDIVVHYVRSADAAASVRAQIEDMGRRCRTLCFDVADRRQCAESITRDIDEYGAYHGAVCNAGLVRDNAFPAMSSIPPAAPSVWPVMPLVELHGTSRPKTASIALSSAASLLGVAVPCRFT